MSFKQKLVIGMIGACGYFVGEVGERIYHALKDEYRGFQPVPAAISNLAFDAQPVRFKTQDELTIAGSYAPSKNGATIILIHGSSNNRKQLEDLGKLLVDNGFGVLSYDSRALGESEGTISGYGEKESYDLLAAVDFLQSRGVDSQRIGAYGFSVGAFTLARTAAHDDRIKSVILASVPSSAFELDSDSDGGGIHGFITGNARMMLAELMGIKAYGLNTVDTIQFISPRPILILTGEMDTGVPIKRAKEVFDAAKEPKALEIFPGAGHGDYRQKNKERFESVVLDHFAKTLNVKLLMHRPKHTDKYTKN